MTEKQTAEDNVVWLDDHVRANTKPGRCRCGGEVAPHTQHWAHPCCHGCADETVATIRRWGGLGELEVTP